MSHHIDTAREEPYAAATQSAHTVQSQQRRGDIDPKPRRDSTCTMAIANVAHIGMLTAQHARA